MLCLPFFKRRCNEYRNPLSRQRAVNPIRASAVAAGPPPCTAHPQAWASSQLGVLRLGGSCAAQAAPGAKGLGRVDSGLGHGPWKPSSMVRGSRASRLSLELPRPVCKVEGTQHFRGLLEGFSEIMKNTLLRGLP